jgi:hypothetical protein
MSVKIFNVKYNGGGIFWVHLVLLGLKIYVVGGWGLLKGSTMKSSTQLVLQVFNVLHNGPTFFQVYGTDCSK